MTPLETALSSLPDAAFNASAEASLSPVDTASRNFRTQVRSSDLTALLRSVRFSLVLIRLSWDLMFATCGFFLAGLMVAAKVRHRRVRDRALGHPGRNRAGAAGSWSMRARPRRAREEQRYQRGAPDPKPRGAPGMPRPGSCVSGPRFWRSRATAVDALLISDNHGRRGWSGRTRNMRC